MFCITVNIDSLATVDPLEEVVLPVLIVFLTIVTGLFVAVFSLTG